MRKYYSAFFLLAVSFLGNYIFSMRSESSTQRVPAAVKNNFDFSNLSGESLLKASKQRLLTGLEILKDSEGAKIGLGHFIFSNEKGEKKLACDTFRKVALSFEAEGAIVSGEKPQMEIEGVCEFSKDMTKINPLYLPVARILGEQPGDGEFNFNEGAGITVRFSNLPDAWPKIWILKTVKLINQKNTADNLTVESDEVSDYLGHPFVLRF